jgi:thiol-disulfide isomerase/thioredoxin/YHS domain-containing protein
LIALIPEHSGVEVLQHLSSREARWLRRISAVGCTAVVFALIILAALHTTANDHTSVNIAKPVTGRWHDDFARAAAEAKRLNKPLLVHFYADWCLPCKRMERESLGNPVLLQQLGTRIVGVKVNFDQQKQLARRFNIRTLPGDVILAPDGSILAQSSGYQPLGKYSQQVAAANNRFAKTAPAGPAIASQPSGTVNGSNGKTQWPLIVARPTSQKKSRSTAPVVRVPKPLLGMEGFNPVSLFKQRKWQKGVLKFAARYKGIEYRLNSVQELREFLTTPERFAPQLLGCDPVILQETDRGRIGTTKHAAYFDGRLYLFVNAQTRAKFKKQPLRYIRTQHVLLLEEKTEKKRSPRRRARVFSDGDFE